MCVPIIIAGRQTMTIHSALSDADSSEVDSDEEVDVEELGSEAKIGEEGRLHYENF